jgi:hypothetical protein
LTILCCPISGNSSASITTPIKAKALAYYNFENLKELVVFNDKNE